MFLLGGTVYGLAASWTINHPCKRSFVALTASADSLVHVLVLSCPGVLFLQTLTPNMTFNEAPENEVTWDELTDTRISNTAAHYMARSEKAQSESLS